MILPHVLVIFIKVNQLVIQLY